MIDTFGKYLRACRMTAGLSQIRLVELAPDGWSVSQTAVSAALASCRPLKRSRWVMMRIHTPASESRHSASATPG